MSGRPGAGGEGKAAEGGGTGSERHWCDDGAMGAAVDAGVGLAFLPGRPKGWRRRRHRLGREAARGFDSRRQAWWRSGRVIPGGQIGKREERKGTGMDREKEQGQRIRSRTITREKIKVERRKVGNGEKIEVNVAPCNID